MGTKYTSLTNYLTKYAITYREKHSLAVDALVDVLFLSNNKTVVFNVAAVEDPTKIGVNNIWWDGALLRKCIGLSDTGQGTAQTYVTIIPEDGNPVGDEILFNLEFTTNIQLISEYVDINKPGEQQLVPPEGLKGDLKVHDGTEYVNFPVGPAGYALITDPNSPYGVRWSPAGGDTGDITWKGVWSDLEPYRLGDVVRHNDETYIAVRTSQNKEPPFDEYWTVFVGRGAIGPQGPQGPAGDKGEPGIEWQGEFIPGTSYNVSHAVSWGGASYRANTTTTETPPHADWDLIAGGAGDSVIRRFLCSDVVQLGRLVASMDDGSVTHADCRTLDHRHRVLGVVTGPGVGPYTAGDPVDVVTSGYSVFSGWNFYSPGSPLLLGEVGGVVSADALPSSQVFSLIVGKRVTVNEMNVDIHPPITLA